MEFATGCPQCDSTGLLPLWTHRFAFPGDDVRANAADPTYARLWILFERILESRGATTSRPTLCRSCGFLFLNPRMTASDIAAKYEVLNELGAVKAYYEEHPPTRLDERGTRIHALLAPFLGTGSRSPGILDYGGAAGYNLVPFTAEHDCAVLDYERWPLPGGVEWRGQDLSSLAPDDRFRGILLLHTLEHVIDPVALVRSLAAHLSDDGVLYVEVPLGCFGEFLFITEPLTHINFYSEQALAACLALAGLDLVHVDTSYQWVTHGSMWCVNALGRRAGSGRGERVAPRSTIAQAVDPRYALPYLKNPRIVRRVARKLRARLRFL